MNDAVTLAADARSALASLLQGYTAEVTARDKKGIEAAPGLMAKGSEVYVAAIPGETVDRIVAAAADLRKSGLTPVPHIVARNIENEKSLDELLSRLVGEAGIDRALVLGGDRDKPVGSLTSSVQILETGILDKHGIKQIRIAAYPEGHPRIADDVLEAARADKLALASCHGMDVWLVSQFCFDPKPVIALVKKLRAQGITAPFRVGVAGPAERATLVKYALMCGVGASLRALKERQDLAKNVLTGETPEALLTEVALAQANDPSLNIRGVHFFTFGALAKSAQFANAHLS